MDKNYIRIGVDVDKETIDQVDELCIKERWSRKALATVALEYYLRLRGVRKAEEKKK